MSTEQNITHNIQAINPNLDNLKQAFPQCFDKNGAFDFAKFKAELDSSDINIAKEGYSLDWLGKSYARILASDAATTLLKEDEAHNAKPENANSQNLLIKGDNLEVLKHLSNAYYEKVKMIYIDPPYNTGGDGFVYNDDRKFTAKQLQDLAGVSEDEAKRILEFTQSNSNSHSAWLTFMYPRLYIAKQLLKDDGVIFVSIDDNEVAQLRLLMDEVFGEENFIENISWNKRVPKNDKGIGNIHENILIYVKNHSFKHEFLMPKDGLKEIDELLLKLKNKKSPIAEAEKEIKKLYKKQGYDRGITLYNSLDEEYKLWGKINMSWPNADTFGPTYDVLHPITLKPVKVPDRGWRWKEETFNEAASFKNGKYEKVIELHDGTYTCGRIWFDIHERTQPSSINYLSELENLLLRSIISLKSDGGIEIEKLFDGKSYFSYPKPTSLIKLLLDSLKDSLKNEIIMDFFAGSGTTAHSIMQLNSEDGGNRKFILVQLSELIDAKKRKIAYDFVKDELGVMPPTIFEITKERIIRAAKQIGDTSGFKIFETIPIWEDYDFKAEKLVNAGKLFDDNKLTEVDIKALFTTWKTYDGSPLTEAVQEIDLLGYKAYYTKQKLYLMHKGFGTDTLKALLEKIDADANFNPTAIIAFGYYFESKALREIAENIKTYNNKKNIDIDFITRY